MDLQTISFMVDEVTIAQPISIPSEGEKWFKNHLFEVDLSQFMFPSFKILYWSKGIHLNRVKLEWRDILKVVQRYITCEG